ncbi:8688_t:CDS:2, partial [Gigaspora rosea]
RGHAVVQPQITSNLQPNHIVISLTTTQNDNSNDNSRFEELSSDDSVTPLNQISEDLVNVSVTPSNQVSEDLDSVNNNQLIQPSSVVDTNNTQIIQNIPTSQNPITDITDEFISQSIVLMGLID